MSQVNKSLIDESVRTNADKTNARDKTSTANKSLARLNLLLENYYILGHFHEKKGRQKCLHFQ